MATQTPEPSSGLPLYRKFQWYYPSTHTKEIVTAYMAESLRNYQELAEYPDYPMENEFQRDFEDWDQTLFGMAEKRTRTQLRDFRSRVVNGLGRLRVKQKSGRASKWFSATGGVEFSYIPNI